MRFAVLIEFGEFPLSHHHRAHASADDHTDPVREFFLEAKPGIRHRFFRCYQAELRISIEAIRLRWFKEPCGIEVQDLPGHLRSVGLERQVVESPHGGDAGPPLQGSFPKPPHADPNRGHHSKPCNDYAFLAHKIRPMKYNPLLPQDSGAVNFVPVRRPVCMRTRHHTNISL